MGSSVRSPWWIVVGSIFGLMVGNGPVMQFTFGVFLKPISQDLGWDRGTISLALNAGLIVTGIATPFVGRLMDRHGIKFIAIPAIICFSGTIAAAGFTESSSTYFILTYALMGLFAAGQTPLLYSKAISSWFDRQRGFALGIAISGVGLGAAVVPKISGVLISQVGWRGAYFSLGLLTLIVALPSVSFLIRERRVSGTKQQGALPGAAKGLSGGEALKDKNFWTLASAFVCVALAANGAIAHVVPMLTDRGLPPAIATTALATAGVALIFGRLLSGYLLDKFFAPYIAAIFFLAPLLGILVLLKASASFTGGLGTVLLGVGLGAEVDLIAFLLTRYLGNRSFGEIYGYLFALFMLGSGLGPMLMGICFDVFGSYSLALICFAVALMIAIVLMCRLGAYRYPVVVE